MTLFSPAPPPRDRLLAIGVCFGTFLSVASAFASGGGAGDDSPRNANPSKQSHGSAAETSDMTTCPKGQIWNVKAKSCVRLHGAALPDGAMTDYAYALAKADRYAEAIEILDLLADGNTPKALNYRGYATRKLGRTDEGIGYYLRSVALDPRYAQVREYLGEAYVIKGRVDLAKDQLATIGTLCGTDCEPYRDLSEAIDKAPGI